MLDKLKTINWRDIGKRAAKTFIQTFLSYLTLDGVLGITDFDALKRFALTTGIAALAAGVSAVWNMLMSMLSKKVDAALETDKTIIEEEEESEEITNG